MLTTAVSVMFEVGADAITTSEYKYDNDCICVAMVETTPVTASTLNTPRSLPLTIEYWIPTLFGPVGALSFVAMTRVTIVPGGAPTVICAPYDLEVNTGGKLYT